MAIREIEEEISFAEYESGRYLKQTNYESFIPTPINHGWNGDDARINTLLEDATQALGDLNAFSNVGPDIDLFIQLHIVKGQKAVRAVYFG